MFSTEKVNTGRQLELDIARGLAVLFMIFIHVQLYFADFSVIDSYFGDFNDFVGDIPAAPMFMFLLGVGINYSRKNNSSVMLKRGVILLLGGYLLSFFRGFIPNAITAYNTADIYLLYEGINELMYVDILQFSGLAMIMFSIFNRLNLKRLNIAVIGIILAVLNLVMLNIKTDNFGISSITGLFWGSNENSFFPFLTWAFYPIAGFLFGGFLIRCTNKKKFYSICAVISAIVFFVGVYIFNIVFEIPTGLMLETGYYQHFITDNITFTAFVILEISIISFVAHLVPKFLQTIVKRWSKNVTALYCIHWIIITWLALIIPTHSLNMFWFVILLVIIVVLSDLIAYVYSSRKGK